MDSLSFKELRNANSTRAASAYPDTEGWSLAEWSNAMAGEAGETCNLTKKMLHGKKIPKQDLAHEIADTVIYADLLANAAGIDLGQAVREKFNIVSNRKGSKIRL